MEEEPLAPIEVQKKPCGGITPPPIYQKLMVENLTVIRPPILKIYYWESFDIPGLNRKLRSNKAEHEHTISIPIRQIHSQPLKIVYWLRNLSPRKATLTLKRIQNCQCQPLKTQVGFNQFRQLFHCPHRRLIHINQEILAIKPDEVVALTVTAFFFLYGEHLLTYEVLTEDKRKFLWHFHLEISAFDPEKCLLTKELLPVNIKNYYHVTQPLWVQNITMSHLSFSFASRDRGLKLLNMNLTVPRQSVWPLLVDYRPLDYENEAEIVMSYENAKARYKIKARGVLIDEKEQTDMPLKERECADFLHVIYPNRLSFEVCLREERTQLVNVHNYGQKCMEFRWQSYIINEFFSVVFNPPIFRLKAHHSKLCEIRVSVFDRLVHFRRIPIVLEVHRILDRATLIAKQELEEVESIDDPKWKEDSYLEHVYLHLNIRTNVKPALDTAEELEPGDKIDPTAGPDPCAQFGPGTPPSGVGSGDAPTPTPSLTEEQRKEAERKELINRLVAKNKLNPNEVIELSMAIDQRITIFEKLFWKYLSKSRFMRINSERRRQKVVKTYEQVVCLDEPTPPEITTDIDRNHIIDILSRLMQEAINDLAKNWVFIPSQYYERNH
ncbi:uncharacterized protein LOC108044885 [Drosophila rhopaloa]|uniref:Uncharacterized protein LOC108044885 n=1 Tax=Drosophila rhopaloa TaxID=1041015 RepID=A0A6P4EMU0_DRORH|nr:uncharacterized protein LOC108044885 [Drosophila rhopaloa]XP_016979535.1 uncharacterized protein LOC108044885 [Drosophila rhopaloa]